MKKTGITKLIALLLSGSLLGGLAACGNSSGTLDSENNKTEAKAARKMSFVLDWTPNTNHTGIYVAQKLGYYAEEGIVLDIQQPPEGGAEALVAAGNADFAISFQDSIAPAYTKDAPLPVTSIAAIINHNTSGIISLKDKGIDTPKGLESKKYATWGLPVEQAIIKNVMETAGGDFTKLELIPSMVTDVVSGLQTDIDAVWIFMPGTELRLSWPLWTRIIGILPISTRFLTITPPPLSPMTSCSKKIRKSLKRS